MRWAIAPVSAALLSPGATNTYRIAGRGAAAAVSAIIVSRHRDNIARLRAGTEPRVVGAFTGGEG